VTTSGQRIFEAGPAMYDAFTARRAAEPSTQCISGNGIIPCNLIGGPVRWGFGKGRVSPALFFSDGATAGAAELDAIRRLG
jgi:hypothetical protein